MKHDREQKILRIRQRLESELVDFVPSNIDAATMEHLVDSAVPRVLQHRTSSPVESPGFEATETATAQNLMLNINPQFIETINGVVAQEITGDVSHNENDHKLLALFTKYAGAQQSDLISAIRELADTSAPKPGRLAAKQRIKQFLLSLGTKAGDVTIDVLKSYIEKKMLGL